MEQVMDATKNATKTIKKAVTPKQSWMALLFMYLFFALNGNGREIVNRVSPYIADTFHVTADQLGLIGMVSGIGMAIGSIPLSKWVQSGPHGGKLKNRVILIAMGYLVMMCLCGISPICGSFGMLLLYQGIRGFFSAPGENGEVNTVAEWWPKEKAGFALGIHHTAYPWGTAIGGFIITAFISLVGDSHWQLVFIVFPIIGAFVLFGWFKYSSVKRYREFEQITVEQGMTPPLAGVGGADNIENAEPVSVKELLKNRVVRSNAVLAFLCQYSYIGLLFWLPLYLAFVAGMSYSGAASISLIYAITGGLGQIFWGKFSDKHGVHKTLLICCIWLAVTYYMMRLGVNGIGWVAGIQLLIGCCSNGVYPVMYKRAQDAVPDNANILATSITTTGMFIGAAFATIITGFFIRLGGGYESESGYLVGLLAMSLSMVAAVAVLLISDGLVKRDQKKTTAKANN